MASKPATKPDSDTKSARPDDPLEKHTPMMQQRIPPMLRHK
jgi:hypothetical protein